MKISVKLSVKDMYYFMMRHTYSAVSGWFGIILSLAAFVMLLLGVGKGDNVITIVMIILSLLFTVINPVILFTKAWKQVMLSEMFKKPLCYEFGEEGIEITQEEEKAEVHWDEIVKVVDKKNYIIIYMSAVRAFILPVRQFRDEYPKIIEMIRSRVNV